MIQNINASQVTKRSRPGEGRAGCWPHQGVEVTGPGDNNRAWESDLAKEQETPLRPVSRA